MGTFTHCLCRFAVTIFLATIAAGAVAADYPARPIRFVVPFAPGGSVDALARILAPKLAETMGEPWVVDNRGGAAGNIACEIVARSAPDGYTALMALSSVVTANPSLYQLPFSVEKE